MVLISRHAAGSRSSSNPRHVETGLILPSRVQTEGLGDYSSTVIGLSTDVLQCRLRTMHSHHFSVSADGEGFSTAHGGRYRAILIWLTFSCRTLSSVICNGMRLVHPHRHRRAYSTRYAPISPRLIIATVLRISPPIGGSIRPHSGTVRLRPSTYARF